MSSQQLASNGRVGVSPVQLPKGGGSIRGFGESFAEAGPSGAMGFSVPLPLSAGRGYAPDLTLGYSSTSGNDVFGLGWSLPLVNISRRTSRGVPTYGDEDEFIGPSG